MITRIRGGISSRMAASRMNGRELHLPPSARRARSSKSALKRLFKSGKEAPRMGTRTYRTLIVIAALAFAATAVAHGIEGQAPSKPRNVSTEETAFGRAGDPKRVSRAIDVGMSDQ